MASFRYSAWSSNVWPWKAVMSSLKSTEKKSRIWKSGRTEFFREYDEFYIPADCYTINLFHSSLAVSTAKGFEVLTLDKKQPWSVPDLKQSHVATIAARPLAGLSQNPPEVDLFVARAQELEIDPAMEFVMVEDRGGFYEADKHTLLGLQKMMREE